MHILGFSKPSLEILEDGLPSCTTFVFSGQFFKHLPNPGGQNGPQFWRATPSGVHVLPEPCCDILCSTFISLCGQPSCCLAFLQEHWLFSAAPALGIGQGITAPETEGTGMTWQYHETREQRGLWEDEKHLARLELLFRLHFLPHYFLP